MTTHKFKFDCLDGRLWWIDEEYDYEIPEEQRFTTEYLGLGFILDTNQPNHWISFTFYENRIQVFYKKVNKVNGEEQIIYYQKDTPRGKVIKFELTEKDIVAKRDNKKNPKKS